MNDRGFSLIELLVVIAIAGILMAIATLDFGQWSRKAHIEKTVQELYADFQDMRQEAAFQKVPRALVFSGAQQITFDRNGVSTVKNLSVSYGRSVWTQPASDRIEFNTQGVMSDPLIKVICFNATVDAAYDALIIAPAFTSMAKMVNRGGACASTNVVQK